MTMDIRPIRTHRDHEVALHEISRLWSAKKGTSDGDRLEVIAALVVDYEQKMFQIEAPDPVQAILFRMEQEDG